MRFNLLSMFAHHDQQTRDAIAKRERELDDERRLTRLAKREAMDKLFSGVLNEIAPEQRP